MAYLEENDLFILQRNDVHVASKYEKLRTTLGSIRDFVHADFTGDLVDLENKLDQEIIDRGEGDDYLEGRIDGLADRIATIGDVVYPIILSGTMEYAYNAEANTNYGVCVGANCDAISDPDENLTCKIDCADQFNQFVADFTAMKRDNTFHTIVGQDWEDIQHFSVSSQVGDGMEYDWVDQVHPGDYIEFLETRNGSPNDGCYGVFEILDVAEESVDMTTISPPQTYTRITVKCVGSSGRMDRSYRRYKVKVMMGLEASLNQSFVLKAGDTMTGALGIDTDRDSQVSLDAKGGASVSFLEVKGANDPMTGVEDPRNEVSFTGDEGAVITMDGTANEVQARGPLEFKTVYQIDQNPSGVELLVDQFQRMLELVPPSTDDDQVTVEEEAHLQAYVAATLHKISAYESEFDLSTADPETLIHKAYVDGTVGGLGEALQLINQRLDALASVIMNQGYKQLTDTNCSDAVSDNSDAGQRDTYASCADNVIYTNRDVLGDGPGASLLLHEFSLNGENEYTMLVHRLASVIGGGPGDTANFTWNKLEDGDYVEFNTMELGKEFYALFKITADVTSGPLNGGDVFEVRMKLVSSYDPHGQIIPVDELIRVKGLKSTSLTIEECDARYVNLTGDTMTGGLTMPINFNDNYQNNIEYVIRGHAINDLSREFTSFEIDNKGNAAFHDLQLVDWRAASPYTFFSVDDQSFNLTSNNSTYTINLGTITNPSTFSVKLRTENFMTIDARGLTFIGSARRLKGLALPIDSGDAVPVDWYEGSGLQVTGKLTKSVDTGSHIITLNAEAAEYLYELKDVGIESNESITDGAALVYDPDAFAGDGGWVASVTPMKPFSPGDKIFADKEEDAEVGGVWRDDSYNFYVKVRTL